MRKSILLILSILIIGSSFAQAEIKLPQPDKTGGKPLMQALAERATDREFKNDALPDQVLSNLLWAAFGINRPESGKRTAPSANNWQETEIYVAMEKGLYIYNADNHELQLILDEDIRSKTGMQGFTKDAPVNLIFVANRKEMGAVTPKKSKDFYSAIDVGYISQNVYLYCASEGLATVALGLVNKDGLAKKMKLNENMEIIITQPVGYPNQ